MGHKKIAIISAVTVLTIATMLFGASYYFYGQCINRPVPLDVKMENAVEPSGQSEEFLDNTNNLSEEEQKINNITSEQWKITSFDGLKLNGYAFINTKPVDKWAVIVHGYDQDATACTGLGEHFINQGYNVLLPDCRGHGKSEGDYIAIGWYDRLDLIGWVDKIVAGNAEAEIVLMGFSMGAATVMMASGEELPANVKCIIEDSGYTSIDEQFSYILKRDYSMPRFPFIPIASGFNKAKNGYFWGEGSCVAQLKSSVTPTLFIHGDLDDYVPYNMHQTLYEAATCPKEKYVIKGANHGENETLGKDEYWEVIWNFTDKYV